MIKELIKSNELRRLIAAKCGKLRFEEVTDEEIEKIDSIYLTGKFLGADTGIDLSCLEAFPNLKSLSIADMKINQQGLDKIFRLAKLDRLEIVRSDFEELEFPKTINDEFNLRIIGCPKLPFKYPSLKSIILSGCSDVDFASFDLDTARTIHITESMIRNVEDLDNKPNIQFVKLDGSELRDKEDKVIKNIKCSKGTSYSHADVYRVYDSYNER